jgi:hypothetical protein
MPFDFLATRDSETIKVEVKGTTSDRADAILMTSNEVELHRLECGRTGLIIVSGILLSGSGSDHQTAGGEVEGKRCSLTTAAQTLPLTKVAAACELVE